jgi:hypothetical protein
VVAAPNKAQWFRQVSLAAARIDAEVAELLNQLNCTVSRMIQSLKVDGRVWMLSKRASVKADLPHARTAV